MKYDIVVVGGGFAGVAAAIAAGREGAEVLLVEQSNCLGGAAANCLVNPFMPYYSKCDDGSKLMLSAGIFEEICDELIAITRELDGEDSPHIQKPLFTFSEEYLKIVLNRMVLGAGVDILFHTSVVGAKKKDGAITSLIISNQDGLTELAADYFVDCTGDANLAHQAGFPTRVGRAADGLCQPMTLCFRVGDIDTVTFHRNSKLMQERYREWQAAGKTRNVRENVLVFRTTSDRILHFNTTRVVKLNPTSAADVTKAEIEAREQVYEMITFLKQCVPGCEHAKLISTAMNIGIRESRMIDGEYILTQEDLLAYTHFEDGIAACNYDIDIHNPEGAGTSHFYFPNGKYYTIPYRALIPRRSVNLLVAGRCISSTHEAQASYRIMPTVCTLGQAAGLAAAMAKASDISVREIDVPALRDKLRAAGAVID